MSTDEKKKEQAAEKTGEGETSVVQGASTGDWRSEMIRG